MSGRSQGMKTKVRLASVTAALVTAVILTVSGRASSQRVRYQLSTRSLVEGWAISACDKTESPSDFRLIAKLPGRVAGSNIDENCLSHYSLTVQPPIESGLAFPMFGVNRTKPEACKADSGLREERSPDGKAMFCGMICDHGKPIRACTKSGASG